MMRRVGRCLCSLAGLTGLAGCTPAALPREFARAGEALVVSLTDQAAWQQMVGSLDGQAIEPGIEGYAGLLYVAGGKLRGFSGQIGLAGRGTGTAAPSDEARKAIRDYILEHPDFLKDLRTLLGERQ